MEKEYKIIHLDLFIRKRLLTSSSSELEISIKQLREENEEALRSMSRRRSRRSRSGSTPVRGTPSRVR